MKHLGTGFAVILVSSSALFLLRIAGAGGKGEEELWRHRNLGKALFETPTTVAEAAVELKKALDLAPDSFRDRLNYGLALLRSGDRTQGIAELEKAQKQNPSLPHTWFNLGIAYKRARQYPEAIRQFEHMVELVPDEPVSHYNLGLLYERLDQPELAEKNFDLALKRAETRAKRFGVASERWSEKAAPLNAVGTLYLSEGRLRAASKQFELFPHITLAHSTLRARDLCVG